MPKLVYKGKINGNDVVYKERCKHCFGDRLEGGWSQNIMEVVTETGKKFRFRAYNTLLYYIVDSLVENTSLHDDVINEVIIKEEGKKTLKYNSRNAGKLTLKEKRIKLFIEKANEMYNGIRHEILKELRDKPKDKKLESLIMLKEKEKRVQKEVDDAFNTDPQAYGLRLYRDDAKRFIKFFSKINKNRKKGLLNEIFSCEYENKEVIEWLNENEQDLLREAGFNS